MKTPIMIGGQKIGRLRASFLLFKESWRFLKADKELLLVPIFSMVFSSMLIGLLTLLLITFSSSYDSLFTPNNGVGYPEYVFMFAVYVVSAFSLAIAQAIIVHIVYVRAHGGNATLGNGITRAFANWVPLLIWAVITSTVGVILRFVSDRSALVGRIVAALLGAAWTILTFFVVPILILQKKTPVQAVSASAVLFKKTWGETLVSNVTLGLVFLLAHLVVLGAFVGLLILGISAGNAPLLIGSIVGVVVWLILATLVNAALQGVLKTLLYIYAAEDVVPSNFNRDLLESMLVRTTSASGVTSPYVATTVPHTPSQN
jgi:Family of unknown function (DUF6159)